MIETGSWWICQRIIEGIFFCTGGWCAISLSWWEPPTVRSKMCSKIHNFWKVWLKEKLLNCPKFMILRPYFYDSCKHFVRLIFKRSVVVQYIECLSRSVPGSIIDKGSPSTLGLTRSLNQSFNLATYDLARELLRVPASSCKRGWSSRDPSH